MRYVITISIMLILLGSMATAHMTPLDRLEKQCDKRGGTWIYTAEYLGCVDLEKPLRCDAAIIKKAAEHCPVRLSCTENGVFCQYREDRQPVLRPAPVNPLLPYTPIVEYSEMR